MQQRGQTTGRCTRPAIRKRPGKVLGELLGVRQRIVPLARTTRMSSNRSSSAAITRQVCCRMLVWGSRASGQVRSGSISGSRGLSRPNESNICVARAALSRARIAINSSRSRSTLGRLNSALPARTKSAVSGAMRMSSAQAKRTARKARTGSSSMACGVTARITPACRSANPPVSSNSVPCSSETASVLMVKSRARASLRQSGPRQAAKSMIRAGRSGRVGSSTRAVPRVASST